jgi:phosphocarrier protein FPr
MVSIVVVSHSRALAEAAVELIRCTVDAKLPIAAAGGAGDNHEQFGTDATDILAAVQSVWSPDGVLVLMDLGSAILSAEMAREFLEPDQQPKLLLCGAPLIEGSIAAAVQAQIGGALQQVAAAARRSLLPKQEQLGEEGQGEPMPENGSSAEKPDQVIELQIENEHGLHLRPAAALVKALGRRAAQVTLENLSQRRGPASAASLVDVTRLQIGKGDRVRFAVSAPNADALINQIQTLVEARFGEKEIAAAPEPADKPTSQKTFGVSRGIAIGPPVFLGESTLTPVGSDGPVDTRVELAKLDASVEKARAVLAQRHRDLARQTSRNEADIFEAQELVLADPNVLTTAKRRISEQNESAQTAWFNVLSQLAADLAEAKDPYLRNRAVDFREVRSLVIEQLTGQTMFPFDPGTLGILICEELTPGLVAAIEKSKITGVLQHRGGTTSHGAILARALGLPAIGGAEHLELTGVARIALNGTSGEVWLDPDEAQLAELERLQRDARATYQERLKQAREPVVTEDGAAVLVLANAGTGPDVTAAFQSGADGIGLFRSEFLFQHFTSTPSEQQQFEAYRDMLINAGENPVTVRLLDIGGDKPAPFLPVPAEQNPFLGLRGIRLLLRKESFLKAHLRALLRAAEHSNISVMIPMVTELPELLRVRALLEDAQQELRSSEIGHRWPLPVGIMVETPGAAALIDQFIPHVDFISIGTNDLTQYVLSAERGHADLPHLADALHPAVLRVLQKILSATAESGVKASICGEIAGDPVAVPALLALGARQLSVAPAMVPEIKASVRKLSLERLAADLDLLTATTAAEVRERLRRRR